MKENLKLGFGLMRLPMNGEEVDIAQCKEMTDRFLKAGFTYFDTAYFYLNEKSEPAAREMVVSRYPRDSFTLATKMPIYAVGSEEDVDRFFATQLERTGVGYFDYYLLHAVNNGTYEDKVKRFGIWPKLLQKKEQGLIRHLGFSFHDSPEVLEKILTELPESEFVQLQINYLDWNSENVRSRKCYEIARAHGKEIVIMEPIRGGALAALSPEIRAKMPGGREPAAEALRFAASLDGVIAVLSGMSLLEQAEQNIVTLGEGFTPIDESEKEALLSIAEEIRAIPRIPCTRCKYCTEVCPQKLPIHKIIGAVNEYRVYHQNHYRWVVGDGPKASDCLGCGACESNCPQKLPIREAMKEAEETFEK